MNEQAKATLSKEFVKTGRQNENWNSLEISLR